MLSRFSKLGTFEDSESDSDSEVSREPSDTSQDMSMPMVMLLMLAVAGLEPVESLVNSMFPQDFVDKSRGQSCASPLLFPLT